MEIEKKSRILPQIMHSVLETRKNRAPHRGKCTNTEGIRYHIILKECIAYKRLSKECVLVFDSNKAKLHSIKERPSMKEVDFIKSLMYASLKRFDTGEPLI